MTTRERREQRGPDRTGGGPAGGGNLEEMRRRGERFLDVAEEAIDRVAGGDNEAYLRQLRQDVGQ